MDEPSDNPISPSPWPNGHGRMLKALEDHGIIRRACRQIRINRQTLRNWRRADPEYDAAVTAAIEVGLSGFYDAAIDHLYRTVEAEDGPATAESVRVAIHVVKSLKPRVWGDKSISAVELSGPGGGPIASRLEVSFVKPDNNSPD